jgi:hypothetical protein
MKDQYRRKLKKGLELSENSQTDRIKLSYLQKNVAAIINAHCFPMKTKGVRRIKAPIEISRSKYSISVIAKKPTLRKAENEKIK